MKTHGGLGLGAPPCSPCVAIAITRRGKQYLRFWPHGYEYPLELPVITSGIREGTNAWTWNGSLEKPTLRPSIRTLHSNDGPVSHLWLNDGQCQHIDDSTDGLAGQTLPLRPLGWQCDLGDEGMDHDWKEMHDDSGQVDGGPGCHLTWRECRVCGTTDDESNHAERPRAGTASERLISCDRQPRAVVCLAIVRRGILSSTPRAIKLN